MDETNIRWGRMRAVTTRPLQAVEGQDINYTPREGELILKKIHIKSKIPVLYVREGKSFVAYSPALDLASCGPTMPEAKKNFEEALDIFFEECLSMGTLSAVLESCGWVRSRKNGWHSPVVVGQSSVNVPRAAMA
jgi:predicted RNase H-like HicB family nuclease